MHLRLGIPLAGSEVGSRRYSAQDTLPRPLLQYLRGIRYQKESEAHQPKRSWRLGAGLAGVARLG